jgi:heterodisulfide reductase subunit A
MYAIKEAMIAKEHQPDLDEITVLNIGIRAYGKGFEEYYNRAQAEGVTFIQGRPAMINEDPKTGDLLVKLEDVETGEVREIQTNLVVLSSAVIPSKSNNQLSKLLNIELDEHGFFKEDSLMGSASQSTRAGIYLAGCAQGPKDIPDSVAQGSAAAALAEKYLFDSRVAINNYDKKALESTAAKADTILGEPRIGVFVCHCGINIGGILDVPDLVKYAKNLPNVVFATDNLYTCSDDAQAKIQDLIKEHDLTRVVVAACTPRTHEPIFKDTCSKAGLNPYLFDMTNIRDQCSWVHMHEPKKGTVKARDLIRMAVGRAAELQPLETITTPIDQTALVIGGGISGMQCALDLASQKIQTTLVEMAPKLGGRLNQLNMLAPVDKPPKKLIKELHEQLKKAGVKIYTGYKPVDIHGYVGNFEVTIEPTENTNKSKTKQLKVDAGAIVLAIGAGLYEPEGGNEFGYGKYKNVITNLELESRLNDKSLLKSTQNIVFIQCIGAREINKKEGNKGCSRYCCQTTLHQAVQLVEQGARVTVLHKGIRAFSKYAEELYYKAGQLGIMFVQFPENMPPKVHNKGSKISVHDLSLARQLDLPADLIVLSLAMRPNQNEAEQLQKWLKIPRSLDGFFMELHPKLAPVETNTVGIYLCGCAQAPKDVTDSLAQASAAAAKVAALVSNKDLVVEPITAAVNERICWGCGTCEDGCEFGAVEVVVRELREGIKTKLAQVNEALCKGCGVCASRCPSGAMSIRHFTNNQITSQVKAFSEVRC